MDRCELYSPRSCDEAKSPRLAEGAIYSMAFMVLVWLGNGLGVKSAEAEVKAISNQESWSLSFPFIKESDIGKLPNFDTDKVLKFWEPLPTFVGLSYWQRMWIVPEIFLARKLTIFCRFHSAKWERFEELCQYLSTNLEMQA